MYAKVGSVHDQQMTKALNEKENFYASDGLADMRNHHKRNLMYMKRMDDEKKIENQDSSLLIDQGRGLPFHIKSNIEKLSNYSMDDVKVHYNSSKPGQIDSYAYTDGLDIHIAPRYDKYLAHEAWHIVQQKQGRVQSYDRVKNNKKINEDTGLEREADQMANRLMTKMNRTPKDDKSTPLKVVNVNKGIVQRMFGRQTHQPLPTELEYYSSARGTTAAMVLSTPEGGLIEERHFTSGDGFHAEERVIGYLEHLVATGVLLASPRRGVDYQLVLFVSKSPCSSTSNPPTRSDGNLGCHERLTILARDGIYDGMRRNVKFAVKLVATKPYQPQIRGGKQASIESYDEFRRMGGDSGAYDFIR